VLARSAARRHEFALRLALGAGRARLFRQVLVEACMLAALGGGAGVALAYWLTRALVAYTSVGQSTTVLHLSPDLRLLMFTVAISIVAGMLVGFAPAMRASRTEFSPDGRRDLAQTRNVSAGRGAGGALVAAQVALSVLLLFGAGLFVRSLQNLSRDDSHVDRSHVLMIRVEPRGSDNRSAPGLAERFDRLYQELLHRIERMPGVESASLARTSPLAPSEHGIDARRAQGGNGEGRWVQADSECFYTHTHRNGARHARIHHAADNLAIVASQQPGPPIALHTVVGGTLSVCKYSRTGS
jgi:FtsX-like permease family